MKKIDKVILALFSVLIFIESVLIICLKLNLIDINLVGDFILKAFRKEETANLIFAISIVCLLCAIKCIFFEDKNEETKTKGVLMQNDNGKLLISKTTIENIVVSTVKGFPSVENVDVITELDGLNNLVVNVNLVVNENVIIKELSLNIQNKIKEAIKKTSDLEVKEVNVKIKNITTTDTKNSK